MNVKCVNEADYYYSCSCGARGKETFTADASWSHNFSENWFISADGHWHQCLDCGAKKDNAGHTPNGNNVCDKCQFVLSNDGTHYHSFGDSWSKNEDAHWHECSCGLKNDLELHNWNAGKVTKPATESAEGEMLFTCTDCGQTKTEAIEKLEGEKPAPEESGSPIIYAAVAVVALLVVEAVGFAIYRAVAKKKQPEAIVEVAPEVKEESDDGEQD
jgi:hypothetical protein